MEFGSSKFLSKEVGFLSAPTNFLAQWFRNFDPEQEDSSESKAKTIVIACCHRAHITVSSHDFDSRNSNVRNNDNNDNNNNNNNNNNNYQVIYIYREREIYIYIYIYKILIIIMIIMMMGLKSQNRCLCMLASKQQQERKERYIGNIRNMLWKFVSNVYMCFYIWKTYTLETLERAQFVYIIRNMPFESSSLPGAGPIFPDWTFEQQNVWLPDVIVPADLRSG